MAKKYKTKNMLTKRIKYTVRNIIPSTMRSIKMFSNKTVSMSNKTVRSTRKRFRKTVKNLNSKTSKFISSLIK